MAATKSGGSKRGFAAMDPAKQREIASKGGKASHGGGRRPNSPRNLRFKATVPRVGAERPRQVHDAANQRSIIPFRECVGSVGLEYRPALFLCAVPAAQRETQG